MLFVFDFDIRGKNEHMKCEKVLCILTEKRYTMLIAKTLRASDHERGRAIC